MCNYNFSIPISLFVLLLSLHKAFTLHILYSTSVNLQLSLSSLSFSTCFIPLCSCSITHNIMFIPHINTHLSLAPQKLYAPKFSFLHSISSSFQSRSALCQPSSPTFLSAPSSTSSSSPVSTLLYFHSNSFTFSCSLSLFSPLSLTHMQMIIVIGTFS